jgi:hypothetical protein
MRVSALQTNHSSTADNYPMMKINEKTGVVAQVVSPITFSSFPFPSSSLQPQL